MLAGLFGNSGVKMIAANELNSRMKSGEKLFLLDVREAGELVSGVGKINGVVNIPVNALVNRAKELEKNKSEEIVVVCHSGARANTAAKILRQLGFEKVSVLMGGMMAWRKEGL